MKKKILAVLIGGVMIMTCLSGCGKSGKNTVAKNEDVTTENTEETTTEEQTPEEATTEEPTTEEETTTEKEEIQDTEAPELDTPVEYEIIQKDCYYYIGGDEYDYDNTLSSGDVMPSKAQNGDVYVTPDYIYTYMESKSDNYPSGWDVGLTDISKSEYGEIMDTIASEPVVYMLATFCDADELVEAPVIPDTVEYMILTFAGADSLEKVPNLPANIVDMSFAFSACGELKEAPEIPDNIVTMDGAFYASGIITAPDVPANVKSMIVTFGECTNLTGEIVFDANPEEYAGCFLNVDFVEQNISFVGDTKLEPELRASRKYTGSMDDYVLTVIENIGYMVNEITTGEDE